MKEKQRQFSAAVFHRFIPQSASGRSLALHSLAAFLVLSEFWCLLHLHSLFFSLKSIYKSLFSISTHASSRQILLNTASKILAIRQYACGFSSINLPSTRRKSESILTYGELFQRSNLQILPKRRARRDTKQALRRMLISEGKAVEYDRLAAMYVSITVTNHFRVDTTIQHYLTK